MVSSEAFLETEHVSMGITEPPGISYLTSTQATLGGEQGRLREDRPHAL